MKTQRRSRHPQVSIPRSHSTSAMENLNVYGVYNALWELRVRDSRLCCLSQLNQHAPKDMIEFNRNIIETKDVVCEWVDNGIRCNDPLKGRDFKDHLYYKHGITSDSQFYQCRWSECNPRPMRKSSLERHMKEQHVPVRWACPFCDQTFTRESTLLDHIRRTPGHPQLPVSI